MKTFLLIKISLAPALFFCALMGFGRHDLAIYGGALLGIAAALWSWRTNPHLRAQRPLELTMAACLLALALLRLAGLKIDALAVPLSFAVLGFTGLLTCAANRPWTSVYAARQYEHESASPLFLIINMSLSLMWSAVFLTTAALGFLGHAKWIAPLTITGVALTLIGPKLMIHVFLSRAIRMRESYFWKQPAFARRTQESARADGGAREDDDYDVAVIGAGLGGLTAAALLAQAGLKVFVAEHHVAPGGFCHSWLRKARHNGAPVVFRFDAGVHDVSGCHPGGAVSSLLARLGAGVEWRRIRHAALEDAEISSGEARTPDAMRPIPDDWRDYAKILSARFPGDGDGILRFFETAKEIHDGLFSTAAVAGVPGAPASVQEMLDFAKNNPLTVRWIGRPFSELLSTFVRAPEARAALLQLSGYVTDDADNLSVLDMIPIYGYYFYGGHYPRGGSGALGDALADAATRLGAKIALKTPVARILVENGAAVGIELGSGRKISAKAVISNADLKKTFAQLTPQHVLPEQFRAQIARAKPATSAFMVHLGLDRQPPIVGLAQVEGDGFRIGLSAPSRVDDSAAPQNYGTLELIALLPYEQARAWFSDENAPDDKNLRESVDYQRRKQEFGDAMIAAAEKLMPDLRQWIVYRADASPLTFARYDWSSTGSIYGVAKKDRYKGLKSPVPGLWLAGAATHGAGVEAAMISGASVANAILPGLLARGP